jgi:hypothetical protein
MRNSGQGNEALMLYICIEEVLGFNLNWETGYPD